jgi:hypothetical protein
MEGSGWRQCHPVAEPKTDDDPERPWDLLREGGSYPSEDRALDTTGPFGFAVLDISFINKYFMLNDKPEVSMNVRRLRLVRALRSFLDFMLILAGVFMAVFALWLLFSTVGARGEGRALDVAIPVALGEGSLIQVLPVEAGPGAASFGDSLRTVGTRGELRFVTTHGRLHLLASATLVLGSLVVLWGLFLPTG